MIGKFAIPAEFYGCVIQCTGDGFGNSGGVTLGIDDLFFHSDRFVNGINGGFEFIWFEKSGRRSNIHTAEFTGNGGGVFKVIVCDNFILIGFLFVGIKFKAEHVFETIDKTFVTFVDDVIGITAGDLLFDPLRCTDFTVTDIVISDSELVIISSFAPVDGAGHIIISDDRANRGGKIGRITIIYGEIAGIFGTHITEVVNRIDGIRVTGSGQSLEVKEIIIDRGSVTIFAAAQICKKFIAVFINGNFTIIFEIDFLPGQNITGDFSGFFINDFRNFGIDRFFAI